MQEKADQGIPSALAELRQLVATSLAAPAALVEEAAAAAEAAGLVEAGQWTPKSSAWNEAWSAICQASPASSQFTHNTHTLSVSTCSSSKSRLRNQFVGIAMKFQGRHRCTGVGQQVERAGLAEQAC